MKILVVQESNWITRNPHQQHHLMERLVNRGHEVRVIDFDIDWNKRDNGKIITKRKIFNNVYKISPNSGIQVIRPLSVNISIINYLVLGIFHFKEIKYQISEFNPDIILGFGILNAFIASTCARIYDVPFIYYWIDALDTLVPEKWLQKVAKNIERKTIQYSNHILGINKKLADYILSLGGHETQITVLGAGIDLSRFYPEVEGKNIKTHYNISKNRIVLLFMGWLYNFSGLQEIALEIAQAKDEYKNIVLLIVGVGDAYPELLKIKENFSMDDQLILAGQQSYEKIPEFIAASDICLLPAEPNERIMQDIVPIKIYEYMAMKKSVISTKLPGIIMEFGENNGVFYVDSPKDVLLFAQKMVASGLINNYNESAKNFVKDFDWENITNKFESILLERIIHE